MIFNWGSVKSQLNSIRIFIGKRYSNKNSIYDPKFWVWLHKMFNLLTWCSLNIYVFKYFIFMTKFREKKQAKEKQTHSEFIQRKPHIPSHSLWNDCRSARCDQNGELLQNYKSQKALRAVSCIYGQLTSGVFKFSAINLPERSKWI